MGKSSKKKNHNQRHQLRGGSNSPASVRHINVLADRSSLKEPSVENYSRKRSRRQVEFVYPTSNNGIAFPFSFQRTSHDCQSEKEKAPSGDEREDASNTKGKKKKIRESIDEIFTPDSKAKAKEKEKRTLMDASMTTTPPNIATMEGKLSGLSVEDAMMDKSGLRPRANSTDGELNLPRRGLCDEYIILASHRWHQNRRLLSPRGFRNIGNTCFLNSTLQCLAALPPFCQSLLAMPDRTPQNNGKKTSQGKRITFLLRALFSKIVDAKGGGPIAPRDVVGALPSLGTCGGRYGGYKFRIGRQEDAHEFLIHLLDAMHDGELREAGINQQKSGWRDRLPIPRLDETTFIHRIFGGYLRSQLQCPNCKYCSNTYDPFLDLALEVSGNAINSVQAAFLEFTKKETLDSDNRWKCGGCGRHVRARKALTVFRPPLALCVQMKRFAFSSGGFSSHFQFKNRPFGGGGRGNKITKKIAFPSDFDLPLSDNRSCAYGLTGVVVHVGGSSDSGHYTAFVKGKASWYHSDDEHIQAVSEKTVLQQRNAYLLFYCRKEVKLEFPSPPWRGSMSAEEATELGRARARARADSLTQLEAQHETSRSVEDSDPTKGSKVASTLPIAARHVKDASAKPGAAPTKSPMKPTKKQAVPNSGNIPSANPHSSLPGGMSPSNSVADSSSDSDSFSSSSSDSDSDSDSSSDDPEEKQDAYKIRKAKPIVSSANPQSESKVSIGDMATTIAHVNQTTVGECKNNAESSSKARRDSDSSSSSSSSEPQAKDVQNSTKANEKPVNATGAKHTLSNHPSNEKEGSDSLKSGKPKKKSPGPTRVILDRGRGREKVSVMVGTKFKTRKGWTPHTTTGTRTSGEEYELLGNRTIDKWEEPQDSEVSRSRSQIVDTMEKKRRAKKRKFFLDRWDAALDRGRVKKVKQQTRDKTLNSGAPQNSFQRILTGMQKMNRGRPKGYSAYEKHAPPSKKKRKS